MIAKLGLCFPAVRNNNINRDRRCSNSVAVAGAGSMELKEKSFYLCFIDMAIDENIERTHVKQLVRIISWNTIGDSDGDDPPVQNLTKVARKRYKRVNFLYLDDCSTYGHHILFPCGLGYLYMSCLDTSTQPLKFDVFPHKKTYPKNLTRHQHKVVSGEIDGKLYRMDDNIQRFQFDPNTSAIQVFDPARCKWSRLSMPPFIQSQLKNFDYRALFFNAAKKVIGWNEKDRQMYCFDAEKPRIGWTYLGHDLTLCGNWWMGKPFFVHNHHPRLRDFYLIFQYNPATFHVYALFVSQNFDTFQPIETPIHLPACYSEYDDRMEANFELVHLGDRRVALVLHKIAYYETGKLPGSILVAEFEYEITTIEPTVEIKTQVFRTRRFQYQHYRTHECVPGSMMNAYMNGAFLL